MKSSMRVPILLVGLALILNVVRAETLSPADREALLESLSKLRESAETKVDAKFRVALTAYRNAMSSDDAAIELYLNCMERVNFDEANRKSSDFREWKRKEAEKLSDPSLRLALRYQLRWLVLTLQAFPEKADRAKLAPEAQQAVDAIFNEAQNFSGQDDLLTQSVLASVFAKAYDIDRIKVENWPLAPAQLDPIYEQIILPPLRKPSRLAELHAAWTKRIQQEGARVQYWSKSRGEDRKGAAGPSPAYAKFVEEALPKLQWEMELDMFRSGDESGAATRMLAHLEKHIAHPSAKAWSGELGQLLTPEPPAPAPPSTPAGETPAP